MPLFSIIVIHYQGAICHDAFLRGVASLQAQTFTDYEILCYHDGPLLDRSVKMPIAVKETPTRHNDFGHSLRDIGIREASGEYIVHFNADNILYPNALEEIARYIARPCTVFDGPRQLDSDNIIIFPVIMHGFVRFMEALVKFPAHQAEGKEMLLSGNPPRMGHIDCMQLVMKRRLWLEEGGWTDKSSDSDGKLYPAFARKYGYRAIPRILGEHF